MGLLASMCSTERYEMLVELDYEQDSFSLADDSLYSSLLCIYPSVYQHSIRKYQMPIVLYYCV